MSWWSFYWSSWPQLFPFLEHIGLFRQVWMAQLFFLGRKNCQNFVVFFVIWLHYWRCNQWRNCWNILVQILIHCLLMPCMRLLLFEHLEDRGDLDPPPPPPLLHLHLLPPQPHLHLLVQPQKLGSSSSPPLTSAKAQEHSFQSQASLIDQLVLTKSTGPLDSKFCLWSK